MPYIKLLIYPKMIISKALPLAGNFIILKGKKTGFFIRIPIAEFNVEVLTKFMEEFKNRKGKIDNLIQD